DRVCISIDVVLCCISLFWKLLHTDPREACLPASAVQVLVFLLTFSTHERSDSSKRLKLVKKIEEKYRKDKCVR
ncbi:hypothetical protein Tco_1528073, partial [Tanacetum coccineum]